MAAKFQLVGRIHIVDSSEVMTNEEIMRETYNLVTLYCAFDCFDDVIKWLAKRRLIYNNILHEDCGRFFKLDKINFSDRYRWRLVSFGKLVLLLSFIL